MKIFIGIDPGQEGAIAIIDSDTAIVYDMQDNAWDIYELFHKCDGESFCVLEHAQSMPGQGRVSIMNYGIGYGKIKAVLEIKGISFQEVYPVKWKKEFSLIKKGKSESVKIARQLFPYIEFKTERGRMLDGRAEALLMAEYARRIYK